VRVAKRPLLGVRGMGGSPRSNSDALSLERGAQRSEHRKRGFSSEPRRSTWSPTTKIAVTSHDAVSHPTRPHIVRSQSSARQKRTRGSGKEGDVPLPRGGKMHTGADGGGYVRAGMARNAYRPERRGTRVPVWLEMHSDPNGGGDVSSRYG